MPVNVPTSNLAYYAAHAPETVPDFFVPVPLSKAMLPPAPDPKTLPADDQTEAEAHLAGGPAPSSPSSELRDFVSLTDAWKAANASWELANVKEAYFQWRWFYAAQMVSREQQARS